MKNLMKPAEYAKELGISRQAVYAKIKRGILTARNVDGKLYIVVDNTLTGKKVSSEEKKKSLLPHVPATAVKNGSQEYRALLEAKDETIAVLKETVKDLKESNKQISTTLRGEIDLLKEAFHEMRTLYAHQLGHRGGSDAIDIEEHHIAHTHEVNNEESVTEAKWIGIKKFLKQENITKKRQRIKIMKQCKKAYKNGDARLLKKRGQMKINLAIDYRDLLR